MPLLRLDKILCDTGRCSRSQAKEFIRAGQALVNGAAVRDPAAKFDPETVTVSLAGETVEKPGHLYVMLHKPAGVVTATEDKRLLPGYP